jgi:hypothetical protein
MGAFIAKQPNITEQDYINMRGEKETRDVLDHYLKPFSLVIEKFVPRNTTWKEFNEQLKEMGYRKEQHHE